MTCYMDSRGLAIIGNRYLFGEVPRNAMSLGINNTRIAVPFTWLNSGMQFIYENYVGGSVQLLRGNNTVISYNNIKIRDQSECDYFESFVKISRYDFYDNWRLARYSLDILFAVSLIVALIILRKNKKIWDRMFSGIFGMICTILYGIIGIIFVAIGKQFQGFEYGFYTAMSAIHFSNFIRYTIQKIVQEHTVRTYDRIYGTDKMVANDNLAGLLRVISREYVNTVITWIVLILMCPMVFICYYDISGTDPFANFGLSVTIVKFAMPIIGVFVPAAIVFMCFRSKFDLLGYRREFIMMLMICLPLAVITFVIGLLDAVIEGHLLTRKIILITFHAIAYILFDVSLVIFVSGVTCIEYNRASNKVFQDNASSSASGTAELKPTRKQLLLKFIMSNGKDMLADFCKNSGNYTYFSFLRHLMGIQPDATFDEKIKMFIGIYGNNVNNKGGLYAEYKHIGSSADNSNDTLARLIYITEVYLAESVLRDGLVDTDACIDFLELHETDIQIFMRDHTEVATVDIEIELDNVSFDSSVMQFSE